MPPAGFPAPAAPPAVAEHDYFFLYDKPFLGFAPPLPFLVLCLGTSLLYLLCVFVVFPAVAPKSRGAILATARARYWHNVLLAVYSAFCTIACWTELVRSGEWTFVYVGHVPSMLDYMCKEPSRFLVLLNYTFIASKLYEMLDTAFMVWLKNEHARKVLREESDRVKAARAAASGRVSVAPPPSGAGAGAGAVDGRPSSAPARAEGAGDDGLNFLHVYHHCTTFWLFLLVADLPGALKMGPLLNGFVHWLMYWHYARPFPKVIVPFITISQIAQLAFVTFTWYMSATHCESCRSFIRDHWYEYMTPWLMVPVYLVFFVKFFLQRFVLPLFVGKKKVA